MNNIDTNNTGLSIYYQRNNGAPSPSEKFSASNPPIKDEKSLTMKEELDVKILDLTDRNVRQHESQHLKAAGNLAVGSANFDYQIGPDGKKYAVGGEVKINAVVDISGNPEEALDKALKIRQTAVAPGNPSPKDLQTASRARLIEAKAARMLNRKRSEESIIEENDSLSKGNEGLKTYIKNSSTDVNLHKILDLLT